MQIDYNVNVTYDNNNVLELKNIPGTTSSSDLLAMVQKELDSHHRIQDISCVYSTTTNIFDNNSMEDKLNELIQLKLNKNNEKSQKLVQLEKEQQWQEYYQSHGMTMTSSLWSTTNVTQHDFANIFNEEFVYSSLSEYDRLKNAQDSKQSDSVVLPKKFFHKESLVNVYRNALLFCWLQPIRRYQEVTGKKLDYVSIDKTIVPKMSQSAQPNNHKESIRQVSDIFVPSVC